MTDASTLYTSPDSVEIDDYVVAGIRVERYRRSAAATDGRRPPVICVHGGGQASWCWQDVAPIFAAAGFEVHALNWLGRNGSAALDDGRLLNLSIADVVDDIASVARQFATPPILVAHSMGGLACQLFAQQFEVKALLLMTPVVTREANAEAIELPLSMDSLWGPPPAEMANQLFFQGLDAAQCEHYYNLLVPESPLRVHEATRWTLSVDPARITAPVLIVSGALDMLTPAQTGKALARLYDAEYRLEPEHGHNVLLGEKSRHLAHSLIPWLERHV